MSWGFLKGWNIFFSRWLYFRCWWLISSSLGLVHQSLGDVLQPNSKCISQSSSLHPGPQAKVRQSGKGLGSSQPVFQSPPSGKWMSCLLLSLGNGHSAGGLWGLLLECLGVCLLIIPLGGRRMVFKAAHSLLGESSWASKLIYLTKCPRKTWCFFQGFCQNSLSMLRNQFSSVGWNGFTTCTFERGLHCVRYSWMRCL